MDFTYILNTILVAIAGGVATILIALIKKGFTWVDAKIAAIGSESGRKLLESATQEAESVVVNVVTSLQADVVEGLKKASEDGKLTSEEIESLGVQAFNKFVDGMSTGGLEVLKNSKTNFETYVNDLVKAVVQNIK